MYAKPARRSSKYDTFSAVAARSWGGTRTNNSSSAMATVAVPTSSRNTHCSGHTDIRNPASTGAVKKVTD